MKKSLGLIKNSFIYFLAFLWVIPLLWVTLTAFRTTKSVLSNDFIFDFTISNFIEVWSSTPFLQYYVNTIIIVFGILLVQIITTTLSAYVFARLEFWGKNIILILFLIQIMVPNDVLIYPNYSIIADFSLIDTRLGIMLPYFTSVLGIFLMRQTFKVIPDDLEEAAIIDGCNIFQIIWHIFVPLAKPTYLAFGLVSASYHWNNFLWPLIVTNSVNKRPLTVGLARFASAFETGTQFTQVTAATLLVSFPLLIVFLIYQKQFINSFMHSGLK
ncbi:MAG: carbohydrate ABC transporter permease [Halanaerobiales bacterium]